MAAAVDGAPLYRAPSGARIAPGAASLCPFRSLLAVATFRPRRAPPPPGRRRERPPLLAERGGEIVLEVEQPFERGERLFLLREDRRLAREQPLLRLQERLLICDHRALVLEQRRLVRKEPLLVPDERLLVRDHRALVAEQRRLIAQQRGLVLEE